MHVVSCLIGCFEVQCRLPDNYSKEGDVVKAEDVTLSWYASPHYTEQLVISWSQLQPGEKYDTDNVCVYGHGDCIFWNNVKDFKK